MRKILFVIFLLLLLLEKVAFSSQAYDFVIQVPDEMTDDLDDKISLDATLFLPDTQAPLIILLHGGGVARRIRQRLPSFLKIMLS